MVTKSYKGVIYVKDIKPENKKLGEDLRTYRIKHGLSQQNIADMLGYTSRSTIARIENGEIDLPSSKIKIMSDMFGIRYAEIVLGEENATQTSNPSGIAQELQEAFSPLSADQNKAVLQFLRNYKK